MDNNKTQFKWIIPNYKINMREVNWLSSPIFTMQNYPHKRWFLNIDWTCDNILRLSARPTETYDSEHLFTFTMNLSIMDATNQPLISLINRYTGKIEAKWHKIGIIEHTQLLNNLVNSDLIIKFEMDCNFVCLEIKTENQIKIEETTKINDNNNINFVNHKMFSDITLYLGRKKIFAHKIILSMESNVFHQMFIKDESIDKVKINAEIINYDLFLIVLEFMYTGKIEKLNEYAIDLLKIANFYEIYELIDICTDELARKLNFSNVINILIVADDCKIRRLKDACLTLIQCNFEKFQNSSQLEQLSRNHVHLLLEIMKELPIERKKNQW